MKVSYVGDENSFSRYTVTTEGRRIMDVLVDNATPVAADELPDGVKLPEGVTMHQISIAMVDAPIVAREGTKGLAVRVPNITEHGMGYQVDGNSIRRYLHGREATLLARLFVPAAA